MTTTPSNQDIAQHLSIISQMLSLDRQSFPSRAYRLAADVCLQQQKTIAKIADVQTISGIGPSIAVTIAEYVTKGVSDKFKKLTSKYPAEALSMTVVPGVGPKTALKLYASGIQGIDSLVKAAHAGKLELKLKEAVLFSMRAQTRVPLPIAKLLGAKMVTDMLARGADKVVLAGSIRRGRDTVKDIDILVRAPQNKRDAILRYFRKQGTVLVSGDVKTSIRREVKAGVDASDLTFQIQCDLWFVEPNSWGAALCYATGSKEHNVALRERAKGMGIRVNEYGYFKESNGKRLGGSTEKELYELLDVPYCPPELREGSELRSKSRRILRASDLVCDLHHHSQWSHDADSEYEVIDAAKAAKKAGLTTLAMTDHSYAPSFKKPNALSKFIKQCRTAEKETGVRVLAGVECDIMADGSLQWPNGDLGKLDIVLAAIHKKHSTDVQSRLIAAIKHPLVSVIAHPTGRLFGRRDIPEGVDWSEVFRQAAKHNVSMEINGGDERLDLPAELVALAVTKGCTFTLSSDSHSGGHVRHSLDNALTQARRAGLLRKHLREP